MSLCSSCHFHQRRYARNRILHYKQTSSVSAQLGTPTPSLQTGFNTGTYELPYHWNGTTHDFKDRRDGSCHLVIEHVATLDVSEFMSDYEHHFIAVVQHI